MRAVIKKALFTLGLVLAFIWVKKSFFNQHPISSKYHRRIIEEVDVGKVALDCTNCGEGLAEEDVIVEGATNRLAAEEGAEAKEEAEEAEDETVHLAIVACGNIIQRKTKSKMT